MSNLPKSIIGVAPADPPPVALRFSGLRSSIWRAVTVVVLSMFAIAALYPLIFTILSSFKTTGEFASNPMGLPSSLTLANYLETFERMQVGRLLFNSVVATFGAMVLTTVSALFVAYVVTMTKIPGRNLIFLFIISMLVIPSQAIIYPLHQTILDIGLGGTYRGLILSLAAFGLPLGTYILAAYFRSVPLEMIEAAQVDGAGHMRILFSVLLPVSVPALAALSILNFVWMWNDLLLPLVIMGGTEKTTLMVGVALLSGQYDISIPLISAGLIIALIPVILVYLLMQRQIMSGAIAGSVK
jgi:ABC-type glycerol-3-phosphate transport system permease component